MEDFLKLLPNLPSWLSIPIILVTLLTILWPKIIQTIRETSKWTRVYEREKKRLELLKLQYEIEAFKKEKELQDIIESTITTQLIENLDDSDRQISTRPIISFKKRFIFGGIGTLIPIILNLFITDLAILSESFNIFSWLGYLTRLLSLFLIAGLVSAFTLKKLGSPFICILIGILVSLFLVFLLY